MFKLVNHTVHATNAEVSWGPQDVGAPKMWEKGIDGKGVKIAVLDTGFAPHPDIDSTHIETYNCTDEPDGKDGNGHGTHVIGTIMQYAANFRCGVAPGVILKAVKVLDSEGSGSLIGVVNGIKHAIEWGADVISMSLGAPVDYEPLHEVIKEAVSKNILVVCAAGNEGDGNKFSDEFAYPGAYHEVVCVGAVSEWGYVPSFSNSNDEVDMVAPGVEVKSTWLNGEYKTISGTSMATPHVTAVAALIKQEWEMKHCVKITEPVLFDLMIRKCQAIAPPDEEHKYGAGLIRADKEVPKPTFDSVDIIEALIGLADRGVIDNPPDFWLNLIEKIENTPNEVTAEDFKYVSTLMKKFYCHIF